ncbi:hypothetical protein FH603_5297 [Spirosoma sp. LMG 31447]|uniref:Uncharacterized protein n=1 Tax=Spirosoma utsteinense TaxID=2585773 RepID=A0ABR6WDY3_9BACT|nr:hypothetical protein [Spirosoma utsteinense]
MANLIDAYPFRPRQSLAYLPRVIGRQIKLLKNITAGVS